MSELNGHTPPDAKHATKSATGSATGAAQDDADIPLRERLNAETGVLKWEELASHFARGVVLRVSNNIDLIDAAEKIILDDKASIEAWMNSGDVRRATDDDARDWVERTPEFWCVVSAPWVLAQEKLDD